MLFSKSDFSGNVIIVGAGVAGMYAAYLLHKQGVDVQVLEASSVYGGRVKALKNFADFDIELGAEEIHGERSLWNDLVRNSGAELISSQLNELYYFNGSFKTYAQATENTFFNRVLDVIDGFGQYAGDDISAAAFGNISGIHSSVAHIYNGMVGNEMGSSNAEVGMYGLREIEEKWTAGKIDSRVRNRSFIQILEESFSEILSKIKLETPITAIDYSGAKVKLVGNDETIYEADKVIVTVPVSVLKSNAISFSPALSTERVNALERIGMDRGMKIIFKFSERLWPENSSYMYATGLVPLYWATGAGGRGEDVYLTAFVCGENADILSAQGDAMIASILSELDTLFGDATSKYVSHYIQDWGDEEFIQGGDEEFIQGAYSYSKPGTGNAREIIAKDLGSKVYFAGEATHTQGHFATVHGAMETALRAVNEILEPA